MRLRNISAAVCIVLAAIAMAVATSARADDKPEKQKITVERWLALGPIDVPLPAFDDEGDDKTDAGKLLGYPHVAMDEWPGAGDAVAMIGTPKLSWHEMSADTSGVMLEGSTKQARVAYFVAYVSVPRWMKIDVSAKSTQAFELMIDGKSIAKQTGTAEWSGKGKSGSAKLDIGTHIITMKCVYMPADTLSDWRAGASVAAGKAFDAEPMVSTSQQRVMNISDVLDFPSIGFVRLSPDGALFTMGMSTREAPDGDAHRWTEIRRFKDGSLVRSLEDFSGGSLTWAPKGHRFAYVKRDKKKASLRVHDVETGETETILDGVENFGSFQWAPDGTFIIYTINKDAEENKTGVERFRGLGDRRRGERDRSYLYVTSVPGGTTRRLTAGERVNWLYDIHPDGKTALIGRNWEDLSERPYEREEVVLLNLDDLSTEQLFEGPWIGGLQWVDGGKRILATGGPSAFDGSGVNVPDGVIPNDYDAQAFIIDPKTKAVDPITKDFDGTVNSVYWPQGSRDLYMVAEVGEFNRWFRVNPDKRTFKQIDVDADVMHNRDVAAKKAVAITVASSANRPPRLYAIDLARGKSRLLLDPAHDWFEHVTIGKVDDFNFTTADGTVIQGRVQYPPNFDASKKWPCIVYYYGGTSTVTRSFGGRYPKNLWAARGYVIYVLQPSGTTGRGQEFSARHVNDWGKRVSAEIIEGVGKFLDAHPFVDRDRVGCIGASYGGFMTELLVTRTDIFAAAVSHAGISDITSYWGEGYWGFQYNAVSAANSFPWNRPDIYNDQSPLFAADKVTTPLLLLHGGSDTNVPRGESDQMYAALKLLGKEVEYIRVEGQDHWILDYKKRVVWSNAIVSWFDRWLKDQPEWWNEMYPPLDKKADADDDTGDNDGNGN